MLSDIEEVWVRSYCAALSNPNLSTRDLASNSGYLAVDDFRKFRQRMEEEKKQNLGKREGLD